MEITQSQGITLCAFFEAVAQQTTPLPEELKQQMSQAGETFTTDINTAINQLANLAQHPTLKPIYESTRQQIQPYYQSQELNKYTKITHNPEQELTTLPLSVVDNLMVTLQSSSLEQASQTSQGLSTALKLSAN